MVIIYKLSCCMKSSGTEASQSRSRSSMERANMWTKQHFGATNCVNTTHIVQYVCCCKQQMSTPSPISEMTLNDRQTSSLSKMAKLHCWLLALARLWQRAWHIVFFFTYTQTYPLIYIVKQHHICFYVCAWASAFWFLNLHYGLRCDVLSFALAENINNIESSQTHA